MSLPVSPGTAGAPAGARAAARSQGWLQEALAGTVGSLAALPVPVTLGLLVFAPLVAQGGAVGMAAALTTAAVGGTVYGLLGRSSMPAATPSSATALILAALVLQLVGDPSVVADPADPAGRALRVVALGGVAVMLSGLLQVAAAWLGLARLARQVPQPVLAGFMNGVALLIAIGQLPLLLGQTVGHPLRASLAAWQPQASALTALTVLCVFAVARRWPRAPGTLVALLLGTAAYHAALALWPGAAPGQAVGALRDGLASPAALLPLAAHHGLDLLQRHAGAIGGTALALALVGAMESALNTLAVDRSRDTQHDPRRELLAIGVANLVCGACGSLPVVASRARAQAILKAGGQGARAAVAGALAVGVLALAAGHWLAWLPLPVLAGIMLTVAWGLLDRWTHGLLLQWWAGPRSRELLLSLALVALVCAVTLWQGFVVAVALGMLLSMLLFIARMNRSLVRSRHSAAARPSRRIYPARVEQRLQPLRARVLVLELEGALFFGSSDRLLTDAQTEDGHIRCVVLDLTRVGDIDETGVLTLQQLQARLKRQGAQLLLAGVAEESARARMLRSFGCTATIWPDADRAVEAAERDLLGPQAGAALAPVSLADCSLLQGIDGQGQALVLARLRPQRLRAGELLFAAGASADCLYVLSEGSVSVVGSAAPGAAQHRYLSLSPGMMFGETAMLDGQGRSAGVVADGDALVHALSQADLAALGEQHPGLAAQLYRNIALHLSQRLRGAAAAWHASTQPVPAGPAGG
jgi:MFS superfamily sulfate permease-like transporter